VLLTNPDRLSPAVAALLARRGIARAVVLGGPSAVGDAVADALPSPARVFGADRASTAVAVARQLWGRTEGSLGDRVVVGNGFAADAWTLALAASPLAARNGAPLLLSSRDALPPATAAYLDALGYAAPRSAEGWILGAEDSVGQAAADDAARRLQ
jgi:putative cell wall-binding protein